MIFWKKKKQFEAKHKNDDFGKNTKLWKFCHAFLRVIEFQNCLYIKKGD